MQKEQLIVRCLRRAAIELPRAMRVAGDDARAVCFGDGEGGVAASAVGEDDFARAAGERRVDDAPIVGASFSAAMITESIVWNDAR